MQSDDWSVEHCAILRENLAKGMSYSEIANLINASFGTAYSRSAAIGRARRMGLVAPSRPTDAPGKQSPLSQKVGAPGPQISGQNFESALMRPMPVVECIAPVKLRCVDIARRYLALIDLEPGDCRYPFGGDEEGEVITFCGHPRRAGSSYCTPHFHLTCGPGTASERAVGAHFLRIVKAA